MSTSGLVRHIAQEKGPRSVYINRNLPMKMVKINCKTNSLYMMEIKEYDKELMRYAAKNLCTCEL